MGMGGIHGIPAARENATPIACMWAIPGVLNTVDNAHYPRYSFPELVLINQVSIDLETVATGASVIVTFRKGSRATGTLATAFYTLTLAVSTFTKTVDIPPEIVKPGEYLTINITQVGSTVAGSNASIMARGIRGL